MKCINLKLLRWMPLLYVFLIYISTITTVNSVPTNRRFRRMLSETFSKDDSSNSSTNIDTCLIDGTTVLRSSVVCEQKAGCRALQKTGECCPEYKCECEKNGKVYGNGEKLIDPETPCRVCYCQGGEISCNSVTCYYRNDCEPKYVTGRCCPEYDNCPTLEKVIETQKLNDLITANEIANVTEHPTITDTSTAAVSEEEKRDNPLGIKIKEITKPEEIRITKEKTNHKMNSVSKKPTNEVGNAEEMVEVTTKETTKNLTKELNQIRENDSDDQDKSRHNGDILDDEDEKSTNSSHEQAAPSVVHIGDKVLILDHNRPSPITVIGVEGLQRGDEFDETSMNLTNTSTIEPEFNNTDDYLTSILKSDENYGNSTFLSNDNFIDLYNSSTESSNATNSVQDFNYNDTSLNATEFEYADGEDSYASSSDSIHILTTSNDTAIDFNYDDSNDTLIMASSTENTLLSSTTEKLDEQTHNSQKTYVEDDEVSNHELINPGHATIPEDLSIFGHAQELVSYDNDNDGEKKYQVLKTNNKILSEILPLRANASIAPPSPNPKEPSTTLSPNSIDWLKVADSSSTTPSSVSESTNDDYLIFEQSGSGSGAGSSTMIATDVEVGSGAGHKLIVETNRSAKSNNHVVNDIEAPLIDGDYDFGSNFNVTSFDLVASSTTVSTSST